MTKRWLYDDPNPGHLADLNLTLKPHEEFDAPDHWEPNPESLRIFKPVVVGSPVTPSAPAPAAPQEK